MPSFFDDDVKPPSSAEDFLEADDRTLRMAALPLSEEALAALIRYQEAFLAHAERPSTAPDGLAAAHQRGLEASGLKDVKPVEQGLALLRAFCGRRWTAQRLRTRLAELEQQASPSAAERAAKVREELVRLEDLGPLARRHGQDTVALLLRHQPTLMALHTRLSRVLGRP